MFFNTMAYHAKVLFLMGMDAKIFLCSVNQSKTLIRWSLTYSRKVGLNDFCIVLTVHCFFRNCLPGGHFVHPIVSIHGILVSGGVILKQCGYLVNHNVIERQHIRCRLGLY